jgi:Zn-dependent protease with chaperone function
MPLYWLLLIVLSIGVGLLMPVDAAGGLDRAGLGSDPWEVANAPASRWLWLCSAAILLGWSLIGEGLLRRAAKRLKEPAPGGRRDPIALEQWLDGWLQRLRWVWIPLNVLLLLSLRLPTPLSILKRGTDSLFLGTLMVLLPSLLALGLLVHWGDRFQSHLARAAGVRPVRWGWRSLWIESSWLMGPLLVLMTLLDVAAVIGVRQWIAHPIAMGTLVLVGLPLGLPWMMTRVWQTTAMAGTVDGQWLASIARDRGVRGVEFRGWNTGGRLATAAAIGVVPGARKVFISDGLQSHLTRPQLAMIALHELAHFKRWHLPLRLLALLPGWMVGLAMLEALPSTGATDAWVRPLALATGIGVSVVVLRWMSHATEFDADRVACKMAAAMHGRCPDVPATMADAAEQLASALQRIVGRSAAARKTTWMHPSLDDRLVALARQRNTITLENRGGDGLGVSEPGHVGG